ncbi:MAG: serine hydrolase [Proteobacteria bacterium]|nr:serine hydrolase [Pseudomonadota bacterium]
MAAGCQGGFTTLPAASLAAAAAWVEQRETNALIIIHKGKVQLERYWNGMQPDELANGRALTRTITPMLLGFAVESGKLGLEDPLDKFITEWRDDPRGRITVRQLAQNVSGLEVAPSIPPASSMATRTSTLPTAATWCARR